MSRINPDSYRDGCAFFDTFFAQAEKVEWGHAANGAQGI